MELEQLPEIITAQHIADYLQISRKVVYELFQLTEDAGGIKVFRIGTSIRVKKTELVKWIDKRSVAS